MHPLTQKNSYKNPCGFDAKATFSPGLGLIESYISDKLNLILNGKNATSASALPDGLSENAQTLIASRGVETTSLTLQDIISNNHSVQASRPSNIQGPLFNIHTRSIHLSLDSLIAVLTQSLLYLKQLLANLFINQKDLVVQDLKMMLQSFKYQEILSHVDQEKILEFFHSDKIEDLKSYIVSIAGRFNLSPTDQSKIIDLIDNNDIIGGMRFLYTLQLLRTLIAKTEWQGLLTAKELEQYAKAYNKFLATDSVEQIYPIICNLSSRAHIQEWLISLETLLQPHNHQITERSLLNSIRNSLHANEPIEFCKNAATLLSQLDNYNIKGLQKAYLEDLKEFFVEASQKPVDSSSIFLKIAQQVSQEKYLSAWNVRIKDLYELIETENRRKTIDDATVDIQRVEQVVQKSLVLWEECGKLLDSENNQSLSSSLYSAQFGNLVGTWRKVNKQFSILAKKYNSHIQDHAHCNCHYAKQLPPSILNRWNALPERIHGIKSVTQPPQRIADKEEKTSLYFLCTMGSGHRMATDAVIGYTKENIQENKYHYHVRTVNVPLDLLLPFDTVHNTLGKVWDYMNTDWLYNTLLQRDRCDILDLMKRWSSQEPSAEHKAKVKKVLRDHILKENPDVIVLTYTFDHEYIEEVAEELGIPLTHVATDLDLSGRKNPPTHSAYKMLVAADHPKMIEKLGVGTKIQENQYEVVGPIVRKAFQPKSPDEIKEIRQSLGIAENEKVIVVSSGGAGVPSKLPEILARKWDEDVPLRIIAMCGNNSTFAEYLENKVLPYKKNNVTMDIRKGFIEDQYQVANLIHAANGLHGKPGGLTVYEAISTGTPFLGDQLSFRFDWEKFNNEILCDIGQGDKVDHNDTEESILLKTKELLNKEKVFHPTFHKSEPASVKIPRVISEMIDTAQDKEHLKERRKEWGCETMDLSKRVNDMRTRSFLHRNTVSHF